MNKVDKQRWIVKRYLVEEYEGFGDTREEALEYVRQTGNAYSATIKKETVVKAKD